MSQLMTSIYDILPLPTDICNIVVSYANCIEQVYYDMMYYKYNDVLTECHSNITLGIINNTTYIFTANDKTIDIIRYDYSRVNTVDFEDNIYCLKFCNNLVVDHMFDIAIYSILINDRGVSITQLYKIPTNGYLLYADNRCIITTDYHTYGLIIYDTKLKPIHHILNNGKRIYSVALVNDVLSYNMLDNGWFEIVFF